MWSRVIALLLLSAACDGPMSAGEIGEPWFAESAGQLVFVEQRGPPDFRVGTLDLDSGEVDTLFALPSGAFAYGVSVHPQTGQILLGYTHPTDDESTAFDRSVLVILDEDGPHTIAGDDRPGHWALYPQWSADGASIWYVDFDTTGGLEQTTYALEHVDYETGVVLDEIDGATEPAVSSRGDYVAWVAVDPQWGTRTVMLATADGEPVRELVRPGDAYDCGLPTFSADGAGVFVAVIEDPDLMRSGGSPIDTLTAATDPVGHGLHLSPGDWFAIAIDGTELVRVSELSTIHYAATVSTADWTLVAATREGIEAIDIATGQAQRLLSNRAIRSVAWRPRER